MDLRDYLLAWSQSHLATSAAEPRVTAEKSNMSQRSETLLNAPFWSLIQRPNLCPVDFIEEKEVCSKTSFKLCLLPLCSPGPPAPTELSVPLEGICSSENSPAVRRRTLCIPSPLPPQYCSCEQEVPLYSHKRIYFSFAWGLLAHAGILLKCLWFVRH